ncbi:TetR/AcrR family transcriptional regulator [Microbispora sp. NEAU-D428]|uniref:TetR/AcrR family transcriptional regulator n=1 Tax=Microbispora sitophila TaxID=2771537 RepID=UPI0018683285|nr:TetR/AcrR family transcriptional regulator [Microbispora sitophila]MBE3013209.1 TetR/AcrR family transcriptional regulator [Microbispora sitophila]
MADRTKTQERGRQARLKVLEAALAEIAEHPVADIQVQRIAERAGMSPARVLYYFESRDRILAETFRWTERLLTERRASELSEIVDPQERLDRYVQLYLPVDSRDVSWKLWLEAWLRSGTNDEMRRTAEEIDSGWLRDLAAIIGDGAASGVFRSIAVEEFLPWFNALLDGLAVHVLIGRLSRAQAVRAALRHAGDELGVVPTS